ncbi:MAG: hypothetical protein WBX03_08705, partial [Terriglobales bacterium]
RSALPCDHSWASSSSPLPDFCPSLPLISSVPVFGFWVRISNEQAKLIKSRVVLFKVRKIEIHASLGAPDSTDLMSDFQILFRDVGFDVSPESVMILPSRAGNTGVQHGLWLEIGQNRTGDANILAKALRDAGVVPPNEVMSATPSGNADDLVIVINPK